MKNLGKESRRSFLRKSAGVAGALFIPGLAGYSHGGAASPVQNHLPLAGSVVSAGFAELDITPEIGMEQPGGYGKSYHKSIHDPCKVRAAVFNDGTKKVAIVGIDALLIRKEQVDPVRKQIQQRCGIPYDNILIGASHSHSAGPTGMILPGDFDNADPFVKSLAYDQSSCADSRYLRLVEKQLVEVVCKADNSLIEASMGVGRGFEDKAGFNRRFRMKNGWTYTHPGQLNPEIIEVAGPIDPEVGVIGVWDKKGKCVGCIVNYACHATTSPGGISASWIYYLEQTIRGAMGPDCVVVFVQGACGDVTQVDNLNPNINLAGEDWARFVGGRVGTQAVNTLLSMPRGVLVPVDARREVITLQRRKPNPKRVKECYNICKKTQAEVGHTPWIFAKEIVLLDYDLKKQPVKDVEIQVVQVGPVVFVTNPAEFFCQLGLDIKKGSPFPYTFPVELANDCVGYVPTTEALGPGGGGYETRLTYYSNLEVKAGDRIVESGVELARQLTPGKEPEHPRAPAFTGKPWDYGSVKPELE
jgi:neutral ceramidase